MLMPRFKKPWEEDVDSVIRHIDTLLKGVDQVIRFNLIGGEPLLYKDLDIIINYLQKQEKVLQISFNTNCTVIPSERVLEAMKNSKVFVLCSDYGNIVNLAKMVDVLEKNEISFDVLSDQKWVNFGDTNFRGKDTEQLRLEHMRCPAAKNDKAYFNGKLFTCERAARMYMLGDIYDATTDFAELREEDSVEELREKIKHIFRLDIAAACNYCDLASGTLEIVEAGLQIGKPNTKSKFTIAKRKK